MKTILVPVEDHPSTQPIVETALLVAHHFGARIDGVALSQDIPALAVEMTAAWTLSLDSSDRDRATQAKRHFVNLMLARAIPRAGEPPIEAACYRWRSDAIIRDSQLSLLGRAVDLIVLGRPDGKAGVPRHSTFEAALFESGRPLLLAPPAPREAIGSTIVVAWNGSTETARAVAFAMPFLQRADVVSVLSVEGGMVEGPSGDELCEALRANGIRASAVNRPNEGRSTGEVILAHADSLKADLLIKGAYTQSRLRQMIFGGATSHILANAVLPVFMAH
jgi:nucleotide-binding universal stress UspA family protein